MFHMLARQSGPDSVQTASSYGRMFGMPTAGIMVTDELAMQLDVFWACIKVVSESMTLLPWKAYQRLDNGDRERATALEVDQLLHRRPNPEMAPNQWMQVMTAWALSFGNGYAEIERKRSGGEPIALWPIHPTRGGAERDETGELYYKFNNPGGGSPIELPAKDVYHVRGPSYDGIVGMHVAQLAKEAIGLALVMQQYGASYFGNGGIPAGVITHDKDSALDSFDEETLKNFYESWEARLKGGRRGNKVVYIDKGLEYTAMGNAPEQGQFVDSRKLMVPAICRWFRVPPHKVQDLERATFTNIEHQSIEFVTDTIMPWVIRFEQEANFKLLDDPYFSMMSVQALLRGDAAARGTWYQLMMDRGVFSVNDVRRYEDENGIGPEGDKRMVPANMTTLEKLGENYGTDLGS